MEFVTELLAKNKQLAPANWNHRSTVEVKARGGMGWLLHARTGHEWMLSLCFRVKKNTFNTASLSAALDLTPIDDVEDIHYYSQSPRVSVRNLKTPWQEVTIKVWKKEEIDRPEFRAFLSRAAKAYLEQAKREKADPDELTPWKQLGRKWHLMKKGLPKNPGWDFATIERLLPIVEQTFDVCEADFSLQSKITWSHDDGDYPVADLYTKRKDGVCLDLYVPAGTITIGAIAEFGSEQNVTAHHGERDRVQLRFVSPDQLTKAFQKWLTSVSQQP